MFRDMGGGSLSCGELGSLQSADNLEGILGLTERAHVFSGLHLMV